LKRERSDDRPVQVPPAPGYDNFFHNKILKSYDRSKLPPGKDFFPGQLTVLLVVIGDVVLFISCLNNLLFSNNYSLQKW
jgi:hypothetical protein